MTAFWLDDEIGNETVDQELETIEELSEEIN